MALAGGALAASLSLGRYTMATRHWAGSEFLVRGPFYILWSGAQALGAAFILGLIGIVWQQRVDELRDLEEMEEFIRIHKTESDDKRKIDSK